MRYIKILFILTILLTSMQKSYAQSEPMFSQYSFNEIYINPAYAGSHEALSVTSVLREQWANLEGAPKTKTFTVHAPVFENAIGLGLTIYRDEIGVSSQTGYFANYAYKIKTNRGTLSLGLLGGVSGYQERLSEVKTNSKDAQFSINTPVSYAPNFGFGVYYNTKKFYAGVSAPRMMDNKLIINQDQSIERVEGKFAGNELHYFLASGFVFDVNPVLKLRPSGMLKVVFNAPIEYDLNFSTLLYNALWVGTGYRSGDAINFLSAIQISNQFRVGYSYDYTITPLRKVAGGTHEFSMNYIFKYKNKKITSPRYF